MLFARILVAGGSAKIGRSHLHIQAGFKLMRTAVKNHMPDTSRSCDITSEGLAGPNSFWIESESLVELHLKTIEVIENCSIWNCSRESPIGITLKLKFLSGFTNCRFLPYMMHWSTEIWLCSEADLMSHCSMIPGEFQQECNPAYWGCHTSQGLCSVWWTLALFGWGEAWKSFLQKVRERKKWQGPWPWQTEPGTW